MSVQYFASSLPLHEWSPDCRGCDKVVMAIEYDSTLARIASLEAELKFQKDLLLQYHKDNITIGNRLKT
jgi:hypothetical protein